MMLCQIIFEVMMANSSKQPVRRWKMLVVRTLVVCVVARSKDCWTEVVFVM